MAGTWSFVSVVANVAAWFTAVQPYYNTISRLIQNLSQNKINFAIN